MAIMTSGVSFALARRRTSWLVRGVVVVSDRCRSFLAMLWPVTTTNVVCSSSKTTKNNEIGRIMMLKTPNGRLNSKLE